MKKKGFTLIELLVVIAIIAMLLAILMPALNKVKKIAQRVVCGTNLKGLGTAESVYANDYEDQFTKQGGTGGTKLWSRYTVDFDVAARVWSGNTNCTVGSSLYLLVREADVSPKSFVCGAGGQTAYDGTNRNGLDLVELWDFGNPNYTVGSGATAKTCGGGPKEHVSYGFHQPFGNFAASGASTASFAILADKNPWYDPKLQEAAAGSATADNFSGLIQRIAPYWLGTSTERWMIQAANAFPHTREGQNVVFGDGHSEYCKTPDVGVKHDNIYTRQNPVTTGMADPEAPIRGGNCNTTGIYVGPVQGGPIDPAAKLQVPLNGQDSLMVNDDDQ
ncbi:MAG: type II secretion system protein [Phycisphaerae bacterium]|nr:type II secretion system protein [Phycisphaerae bacterium]